MTASNDMGGTMILSAPRRPVFRLIAAAAWLQLAWASASAGSDSIVLPSPLPPEIDEIQLTYTADRTVPSVSVKARSSADVAAPVSYRPIDAKLDLLASVSDARPFGLCSVKIKADPSNFGLSREPSGGTPCGGLFSLRREGKPLDGLSYGLVRLRGHASGTATISLADEAGERREDAVAIATVNGAFDLTIPLNRIAQRVDLRRLTALVVLLEETTRNLSIVACEAEAPRDSSPPAGQIGFWVWNYRQAIDDPSALWKACREAGCRRLMVQVPALSDDAAIWSAYGRLFASAKAEGIELFALDGYPEAIQEPAKLTEKIRRLVEWVGPSLPGVQLDVEPYLLPDFFARDEGPRRYLDLLDRVRQALGGSVHLSVVVPFWLTSVPALDRPMGFSVMDRADEVAVMSYRTDLQELSGIADDTLRYGRLIGVPVWLALETTPLSVERQILLRKERHAVLADAYLDRSGGRLIMERPQEPDGGKEAEWFRIHHRFTVNPQRLTFAGQSRAQVRRAVELLLNRHAGPVGVVIHDLTGFYALPE